MKGNELKRSILEIVEKVTRNEVEKNKEGNSFCIGFFHQPKRPTNYK